MDDITLALLGDHDAAQRVTERGELLTDKHFNKTLGYYMKCSGCCERSIACNECEEFEALAKNTHF